MQKAAAFAGNRSGSRLSTKRKGFRGRRRRLQSEKNAPDFRSGQLRRGTVHARSYARKPKI